MWRNPNYPAPEQPQQAPPETSGHPLGTWERPGRGGATDTELRATLSEFQGHAFIDLRIWICGTDGGWYPTRKGVSVRLKEANDVAAAIAEGLRISNLSQPQAGPQRAGSRGSAAPGRAPGQERSADRRQAGLPMTSVPDRQNFDTSFDEFSE